MVRIFIIRPGSTEFHEQGRIVGTLDLPLSQLGREQAHSLADALQDQAVQVLYHAPHQSSEETADLISSELDVRQKKLPKLRNLDYGLWQGKLIEEVKERQPKVYRTWQESPDAVCPPDGEMLTAARDRVVSALDKLLKKHREGSIAVVLPEPLASLACSYLKQSELGDLWRAEQQCGTLATIDVETPAALHVDN